MENQTKFKVITERKATFSKYSGSWSGESFTSVNGQTFKITTMKYDNGILKTDAMPVQLIKKNNIETLQFDSNAIFNKTISLISEKNNRVNEKAVRKQHFEALTIFSNMAYIGEIQPEAKQNPQIGTILFLDGYGKSKGSKGNKHVIYQIEDTQFGMNYFTVEIDTLKLSIKDYVKPYADKFGIGTYFEIDYKFEGSKDELNNIIIEAKRLQREATKKEATLKIENAKIRASKIEKGKKLVNVPSWAKSIIVADYYVDSSDGQTDYFNTSSEEVVYLAFSKTSRNNMSELKEASKLFKETSNFINKFENPTDDERNIVEFTQGHSYLPDYFFGTTEWSGWKVNKNKYFKLSNEQSLEALYIAAAEGRYFCNETQKKSTTEKIVTDTIQIIDYSEKAIAVIGDTKPFKDALKKLGGRFNFRLKCGAGWIFSKTKLTDVEDFLKTITA